MATTILSSFQKLKENLEITGLQKSTVSTRQQSVRAAVENGLDVLESFLTGSYSRSTMIAPLSEADIDIFFVLDPKYYESDGQAALLDKVKRVLLKTYPKTPKISRSGQAVTITFSDFIVDVVPAFYRNGGGYLIPNSINNNWIATDPKKHVEIISNANSDHDGNLIPLIKMVKAWNKTTNQHFQSFHLEVMALQILTGVTISNFPSGVRYVFDKARDYVTKQNLDPAGYGGDVGAYLNSQEKISTAVSKLDTAYTRALRAEQYERQGHTNNAIEEWKKIFGTYFPSYG